MRRKSIAIIVSVIMLLTLCSFSVSFADTAAPGQVKISSVKAKSAPPKVGKATVTVKWKKLKGATGYQIFVKSPDGDWDCVKTVGGKKTSAKFKTFVGKHAVAVRALKNADGQTLAGPFSKAKNVKVKSKMTLQKYVKKHPAQRKKAEKIADEEGVTVQFRDNDLIYIYDLASLIDANSLNQEVINKLDAGLIQEQPTFMNIIKLFKKECKIGGVRVVIKYTHNGNPILTRIFQ